jgi:hypothetical protein
MIIHSTRRFGLKKFRELTIVAGRTIWCQRNSTIFDGARQSLSPWKQPFKDELTLVVIKATKSTEKFDIG